LWSNETPKDSKGGRDGEKGRALGRVRELFKENTERERETEIEKERQMRKSATKCRTVTAHHAKIEGRSLFGENVTSRKRNVQYFKFYCCRDMDIYIYIKLSLRNLNKNSDISFYFFNPLSLHNQYGCISSLQPVNICFLRLFSFLHVFAVFFKSSEKTETEVKRQKQRDWGRETETEAKRQR
jgi:hypothetical protein